MTEERATRQLEVADTPVLMALAGPGGELLGELGKLSGAVVSLRGNTILLSGSLSDVDVAYRFLEGAVFLVGKGIEVGLRDVGPSLRNLRRDPNASLTSLLDHAIVIPTRRKPILPKSSTQRLYLQQIRSADLVFGIGPAGTGKTYLAMAMAAAALVNREVKRIVLTRPAVEAGEKLGFLPGDLVEKVNPYLRPLYDALYDMLEFDKIEKMRERGQIEVAPLAFMRGRTLNDSFIILDEAQNATNEQMRMFLTRMGFGSKAVVTGDVTQTDLPRSKSGLIQALDLLQDIPGVSVCRFSDADVVRHSLVQKIVVAYEQGDERRRALRRARDEGSPADAGSEDALRR